MNLKRLLLAILVSGLLVSGVSAQEQTYLSLQNDTPQLQTGQEYVITIRLDNVPSVWLASADIRYDPEKLYVIGTKAGSPVRSGGWFALESSIVVFNVVEQGRIRYTVSQIAPAQPLSGDGIVGTFRIYPLAPGKTTLTFQQAELLTVDEQGNSKPVTFLPALLDLTITGDPVEPPSEATATPPPTETPVFIPVATQAAQPTALVNVTIDPNALQSAATPIPSAPAADSSSAIVVIGIGALVVIAGALVVLFIVWRRTKRK